MALPPQRRHAIRLIHNQRASPHLRIEEARRHDIHARKVSPLARQRLPKVRDERLAAVVDGLVHGDVHDVAAYAGGDDEVAGALAVEDLAGVFGAGEDAVNWFLSVIDIVIGGMDWIGIGVVTPFTDSCFLYSSWVCSRMGLEMAIPVAVSALLV